MRAFLRLFCRDVRSCEQILAKEMVAGVGGTLRSLLKKKKKIDMYFFLLFLLLRGMQMWWQQLGLWNDSEEGSHMPRLAGEEKKKLGSL